ncbi:MAG: MBL fold metallo-hydrolase RNA specificity domain-containing protein, partial [Bacteroidota bacterium]
SGMMNAGRVRHHLFNSIDQEKNTLLIVGYCSPETPGGILRRGVDELKMFGETKPVRMDIEIMDSFSAHADRSEILDFIGNQKGHLKQIFLVHGELERQTVFKSSLEDSGFAQVEIPVLGQKYDLGRV